MNIRMSTIRRQLLCASFSIVLIGANGCGGGGGDYGGGGDSGSDGDTALSALSDVAGATKAVTEASRAVAAPVADGATAGRIPSSAAAREITASCSGGGDAVLDGTITDISNQAPREIDLAGTLRLRECNGYSGTLTFTGSVVGSTGDFDVSASVGGIVTGECEVRTDSLTLHSSGPGTSAGQFSGTVSGSVLAYCGDAVVTCSWSNVPLDDTAGLEAGCSVR